MWKSRGHRVKCSSCQYPISSVRMYTRCSREYDDEERKRVYEDEDDDDDDDDDDNDDNDDNDNDEKRTY